MTPLPHYGVEEINRSEALHQHSLLGKDALADGASYSDLMGSVLSGLGSFRPDDDEDFDDDYPRRGGRR